MLGDLSMRYESTGDAGCISTGYGDAGGKSYGLYQLASNAGSVDAYIRWLRQNGYWFADNLAEYPVGSLSFDEAWRWLANSGNSEDFARSQHAYIKSAYYDTACAYLARAGYHADKHTATMQDVIWSRAVQYGAGQVPEMFEAACAFIGYPNLSYIDAKDFDRDLIKAIYYNVCMTEEWTNGSPALRQGLYNRFKNECQDALRMLYNEQDAQR
ncbi:hypothetical protein [uncultured Phascolarctobacterium sp.]|uniref:VgrG-related protein n=1 Tax=uncultured Phascolarctobacterium sp. TaxID=512296 RepID=UPI002639F597|nr:hypothetical protein [uncultured Phascolarctobacterium sp.]